MAPQWRLAAATGARHRSALVRRPIHRLFISGSEDRPMTADACLLQAERNSGASCRSSESRQSWPAPFPATSALLTARTAIAAKLVIVPGAHFREP
jgi:hypothetical protein